LSFLGEFDVRTWCVRRETGVKYFSTRGAGPVSLDEALRKGIASDGGLFLPEQLPTFNVSDFDAADSIPEIAAVLLSPFFDGSALAGEIGKILDETFSFPLPTTQLPVDGQDVSLLELYHGPTAAFKDVGAGFLAACLSRLEGNVESPLTILVATSGDTGGAVAAAFDERRGMRVVVLFPDGRVSARQEHQLCCWSENVLALKVRGSFDDCQTMVKAAMADPELSAAHRFSSANSINIGRLLPQSTYYADASLRHYRRTGNKPGFVIPTGNLGNAFACIMAREMGLPIGPIILVTNANRTIPDYFESLKWLPRASLQTLASAMDVGDPSNMERLRKLLGEADVLRDQLGIASVNDAQIKDAIRQDFKEFGFATCPHTATATYAWRHLDTSVADQHDWILVATAHPAKFETIVEPLINETVPLPPELEAILSRPAHAVSIESDLGSLAAALEGVG
jgi:threonine synthase